MQHQFIYNLTAHDPILAAALPSAARTQWEAAAGVTVSMEGEMSRKHDHSPSEAAAADFSREEVIGCAVQAHELQLPHLFAVLQAAACAPPEDAARGVLLQDRVVGLQKDHPR
jgi:hypothetical protein